LKEPNAKSMDDRYSMKEVNECNFYIFNSRSHIRILANATLKTIPAFDSLYSPRIGTI
jgi:hypothetical protein